MSNYIQRRNVPPTPRDRPPPPARASVLEVGDVLPPALDRGRAGSPPRGSRSRP